MKRLTLTLRRIFITIRFVIAPALAFIVTAAIVSLGATDIAAAQSLRV